ncbi:MAG: arginine--tRNA ligase [Bacteroidota bacterium]
MVSVEQLITKEVSDVLKKLWSASEDCEKLVQVQKTRKEFSGDYTVVVFPFLKYSKNTPDATAEMIGRELSKKMVLLDSYNVIKGFLNLKLSSSYWFTFLKEVSGSEDYGIKKASKDAPTIMVEYSSPNTNKPLHLGHIRNNLLGYSLSNILGANGYNVIKVNLVNDRGIHICKSMIAWLKYGNGETPESTGMKGDHLVGKYYVVFDKKYKEEINALMSKGMGQKEAENNAPIMVEAREMLVKWEADDPAVRELWEKMNGWVYRGFDETYNRMGVSFDRFYYESETYKLGRNIILDGLSRGILQRRDDGSVWADLTDEGLDQKLLLRSDGTSVYMTQDVGTAHQRFTEYNIDQHIYVVGNEQNYHFQVLTLVLKKLGFGWADKIHHLSYGMVELPEGKMKSREGTVVDADDLIDEMETTARTMSEELGKLGDYPEEERKRIYRLVGSAALKYFILKVDPKKNMTFDPRESIDFNGNTGPFIQYTYARIMSVLRKAEALPSFPAEMVLNDKEIELIKLIYDYPETIRAAGETYNPSQIANYLYDLSKEFNQFYHDYSILSAEDEAVKDFRLQMTAITGDIIRSGMALLGIGVPERM